MNFIILHISSMLITYALFVITRDSIFAFQDWRAKKLASAEPQPQPDHFDVVELAKLAATIYEPNKGNYADAIEQATTLLHIAALSLRDRTEFANYKDTELWIRNREAMLAGTEK